MESSKCLLNLPAVASQWRTGLADSIATFEARTKQFQEILWKKLDNYLRLCGTQKNRRLLHGDLHHENVIFDDRRGWLAIDPKGVVGEIEYEIGAALRNPVDRPDLCASREILQRRIQIFEQALHLDTVRAVRWAFAQAVLSAIWSWEDGEPVDNANSPLLLAREIRVS